MPKFNTTVSFEESAAINSHNSPIRQSYRGWVLEERQRRDQETYDALL